MRDLVYESVDTFVTCLEITGNPEAAFQACWEIQVYEQTGQLPENAIYLQHVEETDNGRIWVWQDFRSRRD